MNPLASLIRAMLQHQLNVPAGVSSSADDTAIVQDLERVVMEGGIASFLESADPTTATQFITWMESHQSDPNLVTNVFTTFPALFAAVHREMVETIEASKRTIVAQ